MAKSQANPRPQTGAFVAYYRVSTSKQGSRGPGIEAQKAAVAQYLNGGDWRLIDEFVEVESGRRSDRPELDKALALARVHRASLVVAKLDRLTRSVAFLCRLLETQIDIHIVDMPQTEGAIGQYMLVQMASVAQLEAAMISARTKAALAAIKGRGKRLGGWRGYVMPQSIRLAGAEARKQAAQARALDLAETVSELKAAGHVTCRELARALNDRQIPAARGGQWNAATAQRLMRRLSRAPGDWSLSMGAGPF